MYHKSKILFVFLILAVPFLLAFSAPSFNLPLILSVFGALVGIPALWAFLVDVLKWSGVVTDGTAGKWFAALNLITLIAVAIAVSFYPTFDLSSVDLVIGDMVKFAVLLFTYLLQIGIGKTAHGIYVNQLKLRSFSFSAGNR